MASRSLTLKFLSDTSGINKGVKDVNSKLDGVGKMAKRLGGVMAAAFAADKVKDFAVASFKLGETAKEVTRAFDNLAGTSLRELRKATGGAVDDLTLMQKAVSANNLGIPVENLATLFEFASKRAAQTGENVNHLVDSIVTGIGRKSSLVLDNLGIVMSTAGKTTAEVSEEVLKLANEALPKMGDVGTKATDRLTTAWTNFQLAVGEFLAGPGGEFLDWVTNVLTGLTNALNRNRMLLAAEDIAEVTENLKIAKLEYYQLIEAIEKSGLVTEENANALTEKGKVITELENRLKKLKGETVESTNIVTTNSSVVAQNTQTLASNTVALNNQGVAINNTAASWQNYSTIASVASQTNTSLAMSLQSQANVALANMNSNLANVNINSIASSKGIQILTRDMNGLANGTAGAATTLGALGQTMVGVASQAIGMLGNIAAGGKPSGSGIGSLLGGILGTIIAPGAGTMIGSALGGAIGGLFGRKKNKPQPNTAIFDGHLVSQNQYDPTIHGPISNRPFHQSTMPQFNTPMTNVEITVNGFIGNEQQLARETARMLERNVQHISFS